MELKWGWLLSLGCACCAMIPLASAEPLPASLAGCAAETDAGLRLACYDREVPRLARPESKTDAKAINGAPVMAPAGRPAPGGPAADRPASDTPAAGTPPETSGQAAEDSFGLTGELRHKRQLEANAPPDLSRLTARVAAFSYKPRGEIVIRLDNGQVWEQAEADGDVTVKAGDAVTIKAGALGSFWLNTHASPLVRVKRKR
ncbi:MAG: hypothetical protein JWN85_4927 [Gammaproteobacteria bacterium]|nr:hypothetical protein [Gammaproteobacteria bacterium]